jgi:integrase
MALRFRPFIKLCLLLSRNLFIEFGHKVVGLEVDWLTDSAAYRDYMIQEEAAALLQVRILAYSSVTWLKHAAALKKFVIFCTHREVSIFDCTPYIVNIFLLHRIQDGASVGSLESFIAALSFVLKFFGVVNYALDPMIDTVLKFAQKACVHLKKEKNSFGSAEVRAIWDALEAKYGNLQNVPKNELRTFMLAVFQHKTFCRFSDAARLTLEDIFHDVDYFKVHIRVSKTDQKGEGQWVFLPKSTSPFRDAHMLLCLYIKRMDFPTDCDSNKLYLFPPLK